MTTQNTLSDTDFIVAKIRTWDEMEKEYGLNDYGEIRVPLIFTPAMKEIAGKPIKLSTYKRYHNPESCYYYHSIDEVNKGETAMISEEMITKIYDPVENPEFYI